MLGSRSLLMRSRIVAMRILGRPVAPQCSGFVGGWYLFFDPLPIPFVSSLSSCIFSDAGGGCAVGPHTPLKLWHSRQSKILTC